MSIEIKNFTKKYDSKVAVDNLNLTINDNELFGLLGVNGAGKTTTIKTICCLTKPTEGNVWVDGESISDEKGENKIKEMINVSPQDTAVAPNLSVKENLDLMARLYGMDDDKSDENVKKILNDFSLDEVVNQRAKTLSGGWQRRLSIAMALVTEPKILFLDEPTLGLDVLARRELWAVIRSLKNKMTVVLTTHYLEEAEHLCDRIAVMAKGKLLALGTVEELKKMADTSDFEEAFVKIAGGEINEK